jgi:aminoglycoside phosphotransferase (APT) family kinase protein
VLASAHQLVEALTPSPIVVDDAGAMLASSINSWHLLRADAPPALDDWSRRHLDRLAELEAGVAALTGDTLVHLDIRADNLLLTDTQVYFVDWPHAHVGPSWLDAVAFAPSVAMQGGPPPEAVLARWPGGADAREDHVTAAIASIAGFFTRRALLPSPPGLPTLRAFQAAQGEVARTWLAQRTGWE